MSSQFQNGQLPHRRWCVSIVLYVIRVHCCPTRLCCNCYQFFRLFIDFYGPGKQNELYIQCVTHSIDKSISLVAHNVKDLVWMQLLLFIQVYRFDKLKSPTLHKICCGCCKKKNARTGRNAFCRSAYVRLLDLDQSHTHTVNVNNVNGSRVRWVYGEYKLCRRRRRATKSPSIH